ncbi:MAG TPA: hypothetical protein VGH42_14105 [Verrucomicrobiae bacterium]|jgi:hypothetical protein
MTQPSVLQEKKLRQPGWVAAILITLAGVWLHFYFLLHAGGFWRDEVSLINLAGRHSLGDMSKDSFPVLMPLLVHGWIAAGLGQNDLSLRLLGFLAGLGILAALWAAAWTARRSPPLASLVLIGLNMTVIAYGDSLRAYGLGSLFIVLTAAAMWAFLKNPAWSRAGILAVAAILSVQSLYQNAVLFAAICLGAWMVCVRRKNLQAAAKILLAAIAAAASLLPYWKNIFEMPQAAMSLRIGVIPAMAFKNFDSVVAFPLPQYLRVWEFLALAVVCLACARWFARNPKPGPAAGQVSTDDLPLFAGATLLAAFTGFTGFLWFAALPTQPWYFLPPVALGAVCLEFGVPLSSLPRLVRVVAFALIAATACIAVPFAQRDLNRHFTNVDRLARQLAAEAAPDDLIIVTPWYCGISFEHYFKGSTPWTTLPPLSDHSWHRYDLVKIQMQNTNAIRPVIDRMAATLQSGHHVWMVASVGWINIPAPGATPFILPPPPLKDFGWSDLPYIYAWNSQVAGFLADHSRQFGRLKNPAGDVRSDEKLELFAADGWKDTAPPVSTLKTNAP